MASLALDLLASRLDRLQHEHEGILIRAESDILSAIDVTRRATVGTAFDRLRRESERALKQHCQKVRDEVLRFAEATTHSLAPEDVASVIQCASRHVDADHHLLRFDMFGDAVTRHFGRAGATIDLSAFRLDLSRALLHAGSFNSVSSFKSTLRDDLELLRRKQLLAAEVDRKAQSKATPAWMSKWGFWIGLVVAAATIAGTYRTFVPATIASQSSSRQAAPEPIASDSARIVPAPPGSVHIAAPSAATGSSASASHVPASK
jgi:hypothetical protein